MIENCVPLIEALIDAYLFLELSGSDEVNPDSAVRCMESISSSILRLERSDQITLRENLASIANLATDSGYSEFVRALPDMIGLAANPISD